MNYESIYEQLIEKRKQFKLCKSKNTERHHIIPKSFGGDNNKNNLIYLTLREHFFAHLLLRKIAKANNNKKAYNKMNNALRINASHA